MKAIIGQCGNGEWVIEFRLNGKVQSIAYRQTFKLAYALAACMNADITVEE